MLCETRISFQSPGLLMQTKLQMLGCRPGKWYLHHRDGKTFSLWIWFSFSGSPHFMSTYYIARKSRLQILSRGSSEQLTQETRIALTLTVTRGAAPAWFNSHYIIEILSSLSIVAYWTQGTSGLNVFEFCKHRFLGDNEDILLWIRSFPCRINSGTCAWLPVASGHVLCFRVRGCAASSNKI